MAYGLIRGAAIDETNPNRKLIDNVIETIGACFDFPDDNVQLQIIKVCTTNTHIPLHQHIINMCIGFFDCCYISYL